ncbi:MAG: HTH domain-containing protein [Pseudorhodobacter sp.]
MGDLAWKDAIVTVLTKSGQAVHYKTIAEEIEKQKLRKNLGATPANTVSAIINGSLHKEGVQSPFVKTNPGYYMLAAAVGTLTPNASVSDQSIEDEIRPIIPCIGMYWNVAKVAWRKVPKLLGQQQSGAKEIDFAEQLGVYILYDRDCVIYVGRSLDRPLGTRLYEHTKGTSD